MFIKYLTLPEVPTSLLEPIGVIIDKPRKNKSKIPIDYIYFQTKEIGKPLQEWLNNNIPFEFFCQYQVIRKGLHIHKDRDNRIVAVNYLVDTGGLNVITSIFDEDRATIIQEEILKLKKWHYIRTDRFHTVQGNNFIRPRVSISLRPCNQEKFLKDYCS